MLSDLIEQLTAIPFQVEGCLLIPESIVVFENEAAGWLAREDFSEEKLIQHLVSINNLDLALVNSLFREGFQYQPSFFQKIGEKLKKKPPLDAIIKDIINNYQIDEGFIQQILLASGSLRDLYQGESQNIVTQFYDLTWSPQKTRLANRTILLRLACGWDEDHSNEPILWKCRDQVVKISQTACEPILAETVNRLLIWGLINQSEQQKDTLKEFLVQANEEKNKMLIDNLVLSKRAYDLLLEEGWQPDRWEIENLPMTVELFLDYLQKVGFSKVKEVGDELTVSGEEVLHLYRYNGSPFEEKSDCKKVKVLAPGWSFRGDIIIQPKVRETK